MSENISSEQLEKRAPAAPEEDPIADRSLSGPILISSLILMITLIWSLYDELVGMRPWKAYQRDFVDYYGQYLDVVHKRQGEAEKQLKDSPDYQDLNSKYDDLDKEAKSKTKPLQDQIAKIDQKLDDITPKFQDARSWIVARTYQLE